MMRLWVVKSTVERGRCFADMDLVQNAVHIDANVRCHPHMGWCGLLPFSTTYASCGLERSKYLEI